MPEDQHDRHHFIRDPALEWGTMIRPAENPTSGDPVPFGDRVLDIYVPVWPKFLPRSNVVLQTSCLPIRA